MRYLILLMLFISTSAAAQTISYNKEGFGIGNELRVNNHLSNSIGIDFSTTQTFVSARANLFANNKWIISPFVATRASINTKRNIKLKPIYGVNLSLSKRLNLFIEHDTRFINYGFRVW